LSGAAVDPQAIRRQWGLLDGQRVFLAFGYVRDGKNVDFAVRALAQIREAVLVVAGTVASPQDKPFSYYRQLAQECGVFDRCRFHEGFVSDAKLGEYFAGADFVLLTYSSSFHSQSGVLNLAARARKPVLASAAPSALIESVRRFSLGVVIEPDSQAAVNKGMRSLIDSVSQPDWNGYQALASWEANARGVLETAGISV
jgi:glycosyltransferase involved in cell wall biosynthesis